MYVGTPLSANISTITGSGFFGVGTGLTALTPGNISAGSLPATVIASSIAVDAVYTNSVANSAITDAKIADVAANKINAGSLDSDVIVSSIAVGVVYTNAIAASAVTDAKIATGITSTKIAAGALNAVTSLTASTVTITGADGEYGLNVASNAYVAGYVRSGYFYGNGSQLTNLPAATAQYKTVSGYNGTLGAGTTFYAFSPTEAVTITRLDVAIVSASEGGSTGTVWKCGSTASNMLSATSTPALAAGSIVSATGTVSVGAGVKISCWIDSSDSNITESANAVLEYK